MLSGGKLLGSQNKFLIASFSILILFSVLALAGGNEPKRRSLAKINDADLKVRNAMLTISRQLGVTCNYCHNPDNLKDGSMKTHQIAKKHMELVKMLNSDSERRLIFQADCYTCHRGQAKYNWKEVVGVGE